MKKIFVLLTGLLVGARAALAEVPKATADSIQNILNGGTNPEVACQTCSVYTGGTLVGGLSNILFMVGVIALATAWLYRTRKKKWMIAVGVLLSLALLGSYFATPLLGEPANAPEICPITAPEAKKAEPSKPSALVAPGVGDEFSPVSEPPPVDSNAVDSAAVGSEFESMSDEFQSVSAEDSKPAPPPEKTWKEWLKDPNVYDPLGIFLVIAAIAFFIRFPRFRKTRGLFLVASIVYLGFFRGACPCMISSFENAFLLMVGAEVTKVSLLWFLVLIPATFFFGKIWCGWLCHLGALQEVLYHSPKIRMLNTAKAQKILRYMQIGSIVLLVAQLLITKTNIFCHYDPFKVAFNLQSSTAIGYGLLFVMLASSVLIHRPFCRGFCPVGLVLGWVSYIPGARKLIRGDDCVGCPTCSKECKSHALEHHGKHTTLHQASCIMCGECLGSCRRNLLNIGCKK